MMTTNEINLLKSHLRKLRSARSNSSRRKKHGVT